MMHPKKRQLKGSVVQLLHTGAENLGEGGVPKYIPAGRGLISVPPHYNVSSMTRVLGVDALRPIQVILIALNTR